VNADFTAAEGNVKPFESQVKIYGGKIQVDTFIKDHSPASVAFQEQSQIRSFARQFTVDTFEGTGGTSLLGVQGWLGLAGYTGQVISAGTSASGDVLTLDMMDEALSYIDRTPDTAIYCNQIIARRLKRIARGVGTDQTVQNMQYGMDEFGRWTPQYDGIPVVALQDGKGANMLATTEIDGAASQSNTCSLYIVAWGPESATYFSSSSIIGANGVPLPKLMKATDGTNYEYERLEWYVGFVPHRPRCIVRIKYLKNSAS
jgi:hypothetical protein